MTLWVVKGGRLGEREDRFLDHSVIGIGWDDMPDLAPLADREAMKARYREVYPDDAEGRVAVQAGQLLAFAHAMAMGDLVVVPLKPPRSLIAVGRIAGPYRHTIELGPDMRHVRPLEWLVTDLARTRFERDLLYSFGSFLGVSRVTRHDAEARVEAVLSGTPLPAPSDVDPVDVTSEPGRDLARDAKDEIIDLVRSRFKGHGLARIVDAILRAQGYATHMSPPGPDGGVDIVAGAVPLGFGEPRIVVQVKSGDGPADVSVLRALKGVMADYRADQGLLVAWGGFKDTLIREARNDYFKLRLWDQEELLEALFAEYERLDEDLRAELPLKRIWTIAREGQVE